MTTRFALNDPEEIVNGRRVRRLLKVTFVMGDFQVCCNCKASGGIFMQRVLIRFCKV